MTSTKTLGERVQPCHLISATTAILDCQRYRNILAVAVDAREELWVMEFRTYRLLHSLPLSPPSMRSYAAFEACRFFASCVEYRRCVSIKDVVDKVLLCGGQKQLIDATEAVEKYTDNVMYIFLRLSYMLTELVV